ncbi:hypothetical protein LNTAR_15302 [Lentisphaera araneosa HTCC2155]|uniref:DUF2787 domain-containing protein n=1 Tax=Lentisphaera araneosa HTCC2155 TaxID=313628 RepID=A6DRI5_9BACT|nr:DUF2787 family protein [Lentisphaera araneosa]EDM25795.1 hypothetical protein LNTAR_15302 [Lentisphaera araneosa HTCC2155]
MNCLGLTINPKLNLLLTAIIMDHDVSRKSLTINFRDPNYSAERGGFHPVEIMIDERELIQYITDFSYLGRGAYPDLSKEIEFDFRNQIFCHLQREYALQDGAQVFKLWQANFVAYNDLGAYQIEVSIS